MSQASEVDTLRLLVVDDDLTTRRLLQDILEVEGYLVDECGAGAEAVVLLRARPYAALLTDQVMPHMTGLELSKVARELQPAIRCFVISGLQRPALADIEPITWLSKPIDIEVIIAAVDLELRR